MSNHYGMHQGHNTRDFDPGPPSRSRKKRTAIGAKGLPRRRAVRVPFFEVGTRSEKFAAKKRARQAIGARGVKTNARRTRKALRVPYEKVEAAVREMLQKAAEKRIDSLNATPDQARAS